MFRHQKACVSVSGFKLRRRSSKTGLGDESEGELDELACLRHGRGSHWLGALDKAKLLDWPRNGVGIITRWPGSDNQGAVCCNGLRRLGFNDFFLLENKDWLNIVDASHHHEFYEIIEASPRTLVGGFSVSAKYVIPDGAITRSQSALVPHASSTGLAAAARHSETKYCAVNAILDLSDRYPGCVRDLSVLEGLLESHKFSFTDPKTANQLFLAHVVEYQRIKNCGQVLDLLNAFEGFYIARGNRHWFFIDHNKIMYGNDILDFNAETVKQYGWRFTRAPHLRA